MGINKKVFISTSSFAKFDKSPLEELKNKDMEIKLNPYGRKLTEDEAAELFKDIDLLIAGTEPITEKVLCKASRLKVISRCGTGMDNVDIKAADGKGIKVFNTPGAPVEAVAELVLALMLSLLRQVNLMDRNLRAGEWTKNMGRLLQGKITGIIGFGRIGRRVAEILKVFGSDVIFYDINVSHDDMGCRAVTMEKLLAEADIITLHIPMPSDNNAVIGKKEMEIMKPGVFLINASRGGLIDEKTLADFLLNRKIGGAALDVFNEEPYDGVLKEFDNVILTPHVGSYAREARISMEMESVKNLIKGYNSL